MNELTAAKLIETLKRASPEELRQIRTLLLTFFDPPPKPPTVTPDPYDPEDIGVEYLGGEARP